MSSYNENLIKIEANDYDLNTLFNFHANFDQLKFVISALARGQKKILDRIFNIEKTTNITNVDSNGFVMRGASEQINYDIFDNNINAENIKTEGNNKNDGNAEHGRSFSNNSSGEKNSLDFIINRIVKLEKAIAGESDMKGSSTDISSFKRRITELENKTKNFSGLEEMNKTFDEIKKNNEKLSKDLEEISIKVQDFNIYEIFKSNSADGGSSDMGVILVQNLEKKVFKKFEFIDEKGKRSDEEIFRLKAEMGNIRNHNESATKSFASLKEDFDKVTGENKINIENINNQINSFEEKLDKLYKDVIQKIDLKDSEIQNNLHKLAEEHASNLGEEKGKQAGSILNDEEFKMIKDNHKKIIELEKIMKVFMTNSNFEHLKSEIIKLNELMGTKINANEVSDFRDNMIQLSTQVVFIKDSLSQLMDDRKMIDDINWLRKKVEALNSTVINLKSNDESHNNSSINKVIPMDTTKFLETNIFNEFQRSYNREVERIHRFTDELKRYIDDIINALKAKAGEKDMKNLEEYLNGRIEELKLNSNKKFADKIETGKNIKYLDTQLKHIIEVYIKKMEKGDNWLMAKKPVNGFSCASCESYIGELPESNQYVPWNKYPIRDPNEKAYRIGNGFSRMLQMLNVDAKKNGGEGGEEMSDDETGKSLSNLVEKKLILPNLHQKNISNLNSMQMSYDENLKFEEDSNIHTNVIRESGRFDESISKEDPYKPKIVKIFKKMKNNNNSSNADASQMNPVNKV